MSLGVLPLTEINQIALRAEFTGRNTVMIHSSNFERSSSELPESEQTEACYHFSGNRNEYMV